MQRWTDQTPIALLNQLNSELTKLPRSVRSLVLDDFPDTGHMPTLDKTTVVILAGTTTPKGPAVAARIDGVFNTVACKEYCCKALAVLGGEADIVAALQEQRLVILQSSPLSICKFSASGETRREQQRTQLKKKVDNLVFTASHAGGDRALNVLLDLAKGDRHVVFVLLWHEKYWSQADFWPIAQENGRLVKRNPGTFTFACSLKMPNFTRAKSDVITAAFAPHPAVSTAAQGMAPAAAAADTGEAGSSSAAAAAAGDLDAPPPVAAVGTAIVTSDINRKRTLPVNRSESSNASVATAAAAIASGGDGGAHERKRPRSTPVKAPVTPHGIDKSHPVTINNGQAAHADTANKMVAAADDDGVNVKLVKGKNIVVPAYARAKSILSECSGDINRISSMLKDYKEVMTANESSRCQALIDGCRGILAEAEGKQQRLLEIDEAGEDGPAKLVCIHRALTEFCGIVEGRVRQAGKELETGVMNVCLDVVRRILEESKQKFSSLRDIDSAVRALGHNSGVDGRVPNSLMEHRIASAATKLADECRSMLSQPDAHSMHQILAAVQKLQAAMTELTSFVQQLSSEACQCFRVVLRK